MAIKIRKTESGSIQIGVFEYPENSIFRKVDERKGVVTISDIQTRATVAKGKWQDFRMGSTETTPTSLQVLLDFISDNFFEVGGGDGGGESSGSQGLSAYQVALEEGFSGTRSEWLASLEGSDGNDAAITGVSATPLPAGSSPTVQIGGTPLSRTFNFGIPKGDKGDSGTNATITDITVSPLPAGANPTVTVGGTATARTFQLGIPKGDKGDPGSGGGASTYYTVESYGGGPGTPSTANHVAFLSAINAAQAAGGGTIKLKDGATYNFTDKVTFPNVSNIRIIGNGTILTSTKNKIFNITNSVNGLHIEGIKFVSTRVNPIDEANEEALLAFLIFGTSSVVQRNITIHKCIFSNPNTFANGIKIVSEGSDSMIRDFVITRCKFDSIGRMGIETQDHKWDGKLRIRDFDISNNDFFDVGTIQSTSGVSVCCISISGNSLNGKVNYNILDEMRVDTTPLVLYGIENAGCVNMQCIGNEMYSKIYGFVGFLCSNANVRRWKISKNIVDLKGTTVRPDKCRGMELGAGGKDISVIDNDFITDGYTAMLDGVSDVNFEHNRCQVRTDNVMYLKNGATRNIIRFNRLDNSLQSERQESNGTILQYNGAGTVGNYQYENLMITYNGIGGQATGTAGNNLKLT